MPEWPPPAALWRGRVGQVLFYHARLEGEVVGVVSLAAGPVKQRRELGRPAGKVRVTLRYALPGGQVRVHRGWLQTDLRIGTRLRILSYQVDGSEILVSFGLLPPAQGGPERFGDRFHLPFSMQSWGVTAIARVESRLSVTCTARPGALLLRGWLHLIFETPAAQFRRVIPFCRLVALEVNHGLDWRAYGGVVGLTCQVGPGGEVEGAVLVQITCLGQPLAAWAVGGGRGSGGGAGSRSVAATVVAVRQVSGQVSRMAAEVLLQDRVLVNGWLEVDVAWADTAGRSRWTVHEMPFSTLLPLADVGEGDRLEPEAQVDRLTRVGQGQGERVLVHVALGVTALRLVHLNLEGRWYRLEQVVGQAVAAVSLEQPLFPEVAVDGPGVWVRGAPGAVDRGMRLPDRVAFEPGAGERWEVTEARSSRVPRASTGVTLSRWTGATLTTYEHLALPGPASVALGPLRALLGMEAVADRGGWSLRCLIRCSQELWVGEVGLRQPDGWGADLAEPVAITAYGQALSSDVVDEVRVEVVWRRGGQSD